MNSSASSWLSELELDNSILMDHHHDDFMDSFDEEMVASMGQELQNCLSKENNINPSSFSSSIPDEVPTNLNSISSSTMEPETHINPNHFSELSKFHNNTNNKPDHASSSSTSPFILNFTNTNHSENSKLVKSRPLKPEEERVISEIFKSHASYNIDTENGTVTVRAEPKKKRTRIRARSQTYDHIIAERKRREQISQLFIALSAIVPGLKKTDKTSVLGDAIKYLKELQERVEMLEEQAARQAAESVVQIKKSQIIDEDVEGSSDDKSCSSDEQLLPQIEARVCNNTILIRVHCEKQRGILVNLLCKVETINLTVVSTNITAFGNVAIDITIITEMEKEFNLSVKDVVANLRSALYKNPHEMQPLSN